MLKSFFLQGGGVQKVHVHTLFLLFLYSSTALAQRQHTFSHSLRETLSTTVPATASAAYQTSIRILALMVDFQQDDDSQTTGIGKFQLDSLSVPLIDPPPHDSVYFSNKIRFVENYFRKVSKGILTVSGDIVSQRVTLSKTMASYSPPPSTNNNQKLAELAVESWSKVDSTIDFSRYDVFVIFHAGAGRDIDLVSLVGYNPTPYDIPSLYLDSTAFASALGQSSFAGIVRGYIKNTIILPETETRILSTSTGADTLQLSINGLFAASLGSFLGLPDLFDTKTGRSGIGQFGLMDGASIFAYNGLFPPEPSAWEKVTLGWTTPIVVRASSTNISIPAVGLSHSFPDTIYKVPINESEYFLVENRNRDPEGNGQRLELAKSNGVTIWRYFGKDTIGFSYDDIQGIDGSVVDVEDYDWAVIGKADGTGKYDGGGILIWHIDENIINANRLTNTVNADPNHRGVNLEEADGSQDIGQSYEFLTAGSGTENGSFLDCWFNGNVAVVYKNIFDRTSFPNSNSYSGAASLVTIKDFSSRSPRMVATIEIGNAKVNRLNGFIHSLGTAGVIGQPTVNTNSIFLTVGNKIYIWSQDGKSRTHDSTGLFSVNGGQLGVAVQDSSPTTSIVTGVQDSSLYVWRLRLSNQGTYDSVLSIISLGNRATTSPCFASLLTNSILVGCEKGIVCQVDVNSFIPTFRSIGNGNVNSLTQLPTTLPNKPREYYFIVGNTLYGETESVQLPNSSYMWLLASAASQSGNFVIVAENGGKHVLAFNQKNLTEIMFDITLNSGGVTAEAIGDVDGDGEKDIVLLAGADIIALNRKGILLEHFPIHLLNSATFTGIPIIGDFDNDGVTEIAVATIDGNLHMYKNNGQEEDAFPVQITSSGTASIALFKTSSNDIGFFSMSSSGMTQAIEFASAYNETHIFWSQYLGDAQHTNSETKSLTLHPLSSEFFPKSRVYNWPNPVYNHTTRIRYYVSEDANITVTIFDLVGEKITEIKGRGVAGIDNEISWDVTNIQSGIYLARVEASGNNKSEVAIIKIAVVK